MKRHQMSCWERNNLTEDLARRILEAIKMRNMLTFSKQVQLTTNKKTLLFFVDLVMSWKTLHIKIQETITLIIKIWVKTVKMWIHYVLLLNKNHNWRSQVLRVLKSHHMERLTQIMDTAHITAMACTRLKIPKRIGSKTLIQKIINLLLWLILSGRRKSDSK